MIYFFNPFEIVIKSALEINPELECYIQFDNEMEESKQEIGECLFPDDGSNIIITLNPHIPLEGIIETLAHELAHALAGKEHDHDDVWEDYFNRINEMFFEKAEVFFETHKDK